MKKLVLIPVLILHLLIACDKEKSESSAFVLESTYDSIRSCPEGGGVFIVALADENNTIGQVQLNLDALSGLNSSCTRTEIDKEFPVAEIIINPGENIPAGDYEISVHASNSVCDTIVKLTVTVYDWSAEIGENPLLKKDEFATWLQNEYHEFEITPNTQWDIIYPTYPQILIVDHVTFLNDVYELRLCLHEMIPPDDWSMIRLRKRNEAEPFFAARQDSTGGAMYHIPVGEYPEMYGY